MFGHLPLSAIAQPGDELQTKQCLLVLSLPGGNITRRLYRAIAAGPVWSVQYNEAHGILIATLAELGKFISSDR